jgi:hypothetical protein
MINRKHFYATVRPLLFGGKISYSQVEGMDAILNEWEAQRLTDLRCLAYIFGTVYHETDETMQPIEEIGRGKGKDYGKKLKYGSGPGKRVPYVLPDLIFFGRGHTQNTWYETYERLTRAARVHGKGWDFLNNPELLLQMEPSIWATFFGMRTGLYTGKKLSDYFGDKPFKPKPGDPNEWRQARRIINGMDRAEDIAAYSLKFHAALIEI